MRELDFQRKELYQKLIKGKKGRNDADQIIKVLMKNGEERWILIHIEVQDQVGDDFPKRMFRYFYRIYDYFDKEVYAIALLTNTKSSKQPNQFSYYFYGTKVDYTCNVYPFQGQDIGELEKSSNPFAAAVIAGIYAS